MDVTLLSKLAERFDAASFMEASARGGVSGLIGLSYLDGGEDWVNLRLPFDEAFVESEESPVMASGAICSALDLATSISVWNRLGRFRPHATLDLRIDFIRAPKARSALTAYGRCIEIEGRIARVTGCAHDGDPGDPVILVTGSFFVTEAQ